MKLLASSGTKESVVRDSSRYGCSPGRGRESSPPDRLRPILRSSNSISKISPSVRFVMSAMAAPAIGVPWKVPT